MNTSMPDTWLTFLEQTSVMFGGEILEPAAEPAVLAKWATDPLAVWNAALSVAAGMAAGDVEYPWPALVDRCALLAEKTNRRPGSRYGNASPSRGQTSDPGPQGPRKMPFWVKRYVAARYLYNNFGKEQDMRRFQEEQGQYPDPTLEMMPEDAWVAEAKGVSDDDVWQIFDPTPA